MSDEVCPGGQHCYDDRMKFEDSIKKTLYGPDGTAGMVGCVKKMVPKKWLWIFIAVFGLTCTGAVYKLFLSADMAPRVYADSKENEAAHHKIQVKITENKKDIESNTKAVEANTKAIESNTQAITEMKNEISKQFEQQTAVILKAINGKEKE